MATQTLLSESNPYLRKISNYMRYTCSLEIKTERSLTLEGKSSGGTAGGCSSGPITLRYAACKAADFFAVFNDGDLDSSLR